MIKKIFFACLLLMAVGVQSAWSQAGLLVWQNGRYVGYNANMVDSVQFVTNINDFIEYEFVDLDLPSGTLWATCNVGAQSPEIYGWYLAWGEVATKERFFWNSYKLRSGAEWVSSYCIDSEYGFKDEWTMLRSEHDAATANWGRDWQMPTTEQFKELLNSEYTTSKRTMQDDVYGMLITSNKNGNSIFLPAAGIFMEDVLINDGSRGYYWSRDLNTSTSNSTLACDFNFDTRYTSLDDMQLRIYGLSVRPVKKPNHEYVDLGLPSGTLWATTNIGARMPADDGDYFAWGEIRPKETYTWENYWYCEGSGETLTKYCEDSDLGTMDFLKDLEPEDDAATNIWGSEWQVPTLNQLSELVNDDYVTKTYTAQAQSDGSVRYGMLIESKANGNSLFLPASGYYYNLQYRWKDTDWSYWGNSIYRHVVDGSLTGSNYAWSLNLKYKDNAILPYASQDYRCNAHPIRPVRKK